jgi:hypothetical protein
MSRSGLLVAVGALALCAAWAVYAQGTGPSAAGTPSATEQCVGCTTPACESAGCCGGCVACAAFVDKDNDGLCDTAGTCTKHANGGCREHRGYGWHGRAY